MPHQTVEIDHARAISSSEDDVESADIFCVTIGIPKWEATLRKPIHGGDMMKTRIQERFNDLQFIWSRNKCARNDMFFFAAFVG
jgi:hypothetical protein